MANSEPREKMPTIGGMSIRAEIDARNAAHWQDGQQQGILDAIAFLDASDMPEAAAALRAALEQAVRLRDRTNG